MYPRTEYEMTESDLRELLESMKPVPCIMIGNYVGSSPQENANAAWARLGEKMGFDSMTVQPTGRGDRFFTAVPSETESQRTGRLAREAQEKRNAEASRLRSEISERQARLAAIEAENCGG